VLLHFGLCVLVCSKCLFTLCLRLGLCRRLHSLPLGLGFGLGFGAGFGVLGTLPALLNRSGWKDLQDPSTWDAPPLAR
jgi:hypothetical protein